MIDTYHIFQQFQPSLFSWSAIKTKDAQLKTSKSKTKYQVLTAKILTDSRSLNRKLLLSSNQNRQLLQPTNPRTKKKNNLCKRNFNHGCYYNNLIYDGNMSLLNSENEVNKRSSKSNRPKYLRRLALPKSSKSNCSTQIPTYKIAKTIFAKTRKNLVLETVFHQIIRNIHKKMERWREYHCGWLP